MPIEFDLLYWYASFGEQQSVDESEIRVDTYFQVT